MEGTVNGKPAVIRGETAAYLPESYELVRTVDDIVGAFDLEKRIPIDLVFVSLAPGDQLAISRTVSMGNDGREDSNRMRSGRAGFEP